MRCSLNSITINYEIYGEGRPVVMLHGYSPDHRLMKGCMEPIFFRRSGWQRIYLDLPGMGKTKGESWIKNADDILNIVVDFIDRIIPKRHFCLAGESYGGYLAQGLLTRKSELVEGLLLICPAVIAKQSHRDIPEHEVLVSDNELLFSLTTQQAAEFGSMAVVQNRKNWERFRDEILPGLLAADESFLERIRHSGFGFSFDIHNLPAPFTQPTLILTGRQDASVGYRDAWSVLENYPRASFAVLDMAGHNLQIEQETLFNALVNEWLNRVEGN